MMKTKHFSLRLYLEGLRQLRLLGLLFTIGVGLIVIFIPIGEYVSSLDMPTVTEAQLVSYEEMNPLMSVAFCFVAPFLTLSLFSFLNKRESDDFYHAIPATRTCLFFSFFAAVVTWLFIFVFGTALLAGVFHSFFPSLFIIDWGGILQMSLGCFVGGLLVAAAVAIAMSVTGTFLMNVLVALLIIFLPRILITLIINALTYTFPLVSGLSFLPFLSTPCNIPADFVMGFAFYASSENLLTSWTAFLYTLVLAAVYTGIALLLFNKRHSEGAGHASPTPKLQAFFRFLIGFTFTSSITLALYADVLNSRSYNASDLIGWIFLYVLAVFGMVVFEIICTRRLRGLLRRCLASVGMLIVANALLTGGIVGVGFALRSYSPDADDITAVRVLEVGHYNGWYGSNKYFDEKTSDIDISDFAVRQMVADRLDYTLEALDKSHWYFYQEMNESSSVVVSVKSGGIYHQRRIMLHENDLQLLGDALAKNKDYQDIYMNLPAQYSHIRSNELSVNRNQEAGRIIDVLQAEIREIGFAKWYAHINGVTDDTLYGIGKYPEASSSSLLTTLFIIVPENAVWQEIAVPLDAAVLPKTTAAYIQLANEFNGLSRKKALEVLIENPEDCDVFEYTCYNTVTDASGNTSQWFDEAQVLKSKEEIADFAKQLEAFVDAPIDPTAPLCHVSVSYRMRTSDEYNYYEYVNYSGYYTVPEAVVFPLPSK